MGKWLRDRWFEGGKGSKWLGNKWLGNKWLENKWWAVAFLAGVLAVSCAGVNPASAPDTAQGPGQNPSQSPSQQMAELHQGDRPIPSPAAQEVDPDLITTESVTYGQVGTTDLQGYLAVLGGS